MSSTPCSSRTMPFTLFIRRLLYPQADAAHEGEAGKQPFLIWEDRGGGEPNLAEGLPSEDEEPDEALLEVSTTVPPRSLCSACLVACCFE